MRTDDSMDDTEDGPGTVQTLTAKGKKLFQVAQDKTDIFPRDYSEVVCQVIHHTSANPSLYEFECLCDLFRSKHYNVLAMAKLLAYRFNYASNTVYSTHSRVVYDRPGSWYVWKDNSWEHVETQDACQTTVTKLTQTFCLKMETELCEVEAAWMTQLHLLRTQTTSSPAEERTRIHTIQLYEMRLLHVRFMHGRVSKAIVYFGQSGPESQLRRLFEGELQTQNKAMQRRAPGNPPMDATKHYMLFTNAAVSAATGFVYLPNPTFYDTRYLPMELPRDLQPLMGDCDDVLMVMLAAVPSIAELHYLLAMISLALVFALRGENVMFWEGGGGCGKSVLTKLVTGMVGTSLTAELDLSAFGNGGSSGLNPALFDIAHRALLFVNEKTVNAMKGYAEALQSISGGDEQRGRGLYSKSSETVTPQGMIITVSNKMDIIRNAPPQLQRRAQVIHFCNRFLDPLNPEGRYVNEHGDVVDLEIFQDISSTLPVFSDLLNPGTRLPVDECQAMYHVDKIYPLNSQLRDEHHLKRLQRQLIRVCMVFAHLYFNSTPKRTPFMEQTLKEHVYKDTYAQFLQKYLLPVPSVFRSMSSRARQPSWGESTSAVYFAFLLAQNADKLGPINEGLQWTDIQNKLVAQSTSAGVLVKLKDMVSHVSTTRSVGTLSVTPVTYLSDVERVGDTLASRRQCFPNMFFDQASFLDDMAEEVAHIWRTKAFRNSPPKQKTSEGYKFYYYVKLHQKEEVPAGMTTATLGAPLTADDRAESGAVGPASLPTLRSVSGTGPEGLDSGRDTGSGSGPAIESTSESGIPSTHSRSSPVQSLHAEASASARPPMPARPPSEMRAGAANCYAYLQSQVPLVRAAKHDQSYTNLFVRVVAATGERMHPEGIPYVQNM